MLQGPWREAKAPSLTLNVDDNNVNEEAMSLALAYLYGHHPKLNDNNAFRVLAAASFLDIQDLCAICTDFIISELWTSNFLAYQVFAESQDYGLHGERVRNACWGYLCQSGAVELKEVLPKLSSQTLHALLTSDELWVPSEEKRFQLALNTILARAAVNKKEIQEEGNCSSMAEDFSSCDEFKNNRKRSVDDRPKCLEDELVGRTIAHDILVELADQIVDLCSENPGSTQQLQQPAHVQSNTTSGYSCNTEHQSSRNTFSCTGLTGSSYSYLKSQNAFRGSGVQGNTVATEGPSEEQSCSWLPLGERHCMPMSSHYNGFMPSEWGKCNMPAVSWGGRIVGQKVVNTCLKGNNGLSREDYDAFLSIIGGGSLLYCHMSFEALLIVRKQLEELGFPCKAVNDGLWLQMLLSQRVQEIGAETCQNCCLVNVACACRHQFGYPRSYTASGYYTQEQDQIDPANDIGNVYVTDSVHGEGRGQFRPVRVHVRGPVDGLAGIGRGSTFVHATEWSPTRFVFSRVPFGMGNRAGPQSNGNDDSQNRINHDGDLTGDGLTALVGLSQGCNSSSNFHGEQIQRVYDADLPPQRLVNPPLQEPSTSGIGMQMLDSAEIAGEDDWENGDISISLDLKTPLNQFPPFRFAVEFHDVLRLNDGQVKHSPEFFYAGSLWKVSVQAFSDEDPQGRRTLGLFIHRRKAEIIGSVKKVNMFVDPREKVTARYQLICPSKRVLVFGSFKQTGTLLPKAPKGWGWRTALMFDELADHLQHGALRVAAVVQLI